MSPSKARRLAASAVLALAAAWVAPALARPSQAFAIVHMSASMDSCSRSAQAAYQAEGWTDVTGEDGWAKGHKDAFASYTVCNGRSDGGAEANIYVSYDGSDPSGDIAVAEATKIQQRMLNAR